MKLKYEAPEMKIFAFSIESTILTGSDTATETPIVDNTNPHTLDDYDPFNP